jgi:hypothetical protein
MENLPEWQQMADINLDNPPMKTTRLSPRLYQRRKISRNNTDYEFPY